MIVLNVKERDAVMEELEKVIAPQAHTGTWARRLYAPMLIHRPEFRALHDHVMTTFPDHVIAFDVVFESAGNDTPFHCDYESLGPFLVPSPLRAIRDEHFLSIHFNLTNDGGQLVTLPWSFLSYLHYMVICMFGIFSHIHRLVVFLSRPWFSLARRHPNTPLEGHVFNNMKLHAVTSGSPRVSYVLRLVKRGRVHISQASVMKGMRRSDACVAFKSLLSKTSESPQFASDIIWRELV
jgi:hypothetical protein